MGWLNPDRIGLFLSAVFVVGVLALTYIKGRTDGAVGPERELAQLRLAVAQNVTLAHEQARRAEAQAVQQITRQQERTHEQLSDIDRRHRAALDRLRSSARQGGADLSGPAAAVAAACAAEGVAGGDGEDVARWHLDYARDAARLDAALDACTEWAKTVQNMTQEQ